MKEAQVGDVLYNDSRYRGLLKSTIVRLTKTQAILDNGDRLKLPLSEHNYVIGESGWMRSAWQPENETLLFKFKWNQHYKLIKQIVDTGMKEYSLEHLQNIYKEM